MAIEGEFGVHTRGNVVPKVGFIKKRRGITEQGIFILDLDSKVSKHGIILHHAKQLKGYPFTVFREVTSTQLSHKAHKCECKQTVVATGDPILNVGILQISKDFPHLLLSSNIFVVKVAETPHTKGMDNGQGQVIRSSGHQV